MTGFIKHFSFSKKARKICKEQPELKEGFEKLLRGFLFWANLPWIVLGFGRIIGGLTLEQAFFSLDLNNPYAVLFVLTVMTIWVRAAIWLHFQKGADTLIKYSGVWHSKNVKKSTIFAQYYISVLGGVFALYLVIIGFQ
ncbi:MAG: hypothetical protein KC646_10455 [Candidatus Cloacimonetes bacterium]|nr:hypothetical protein [Candidatus Cloacimonadota bacterium]